MQKHAEKYKHKLQQHEKPDVYTDIFHMFDINICKQLYHKFVTS